MRRFAKHERKEERFGLGSSSAEVGKEWSKVLRCWQNCAINTKVLDKDKFEGVGLLRMKRGIVLRISVWIVAANKMMH